MVGAEIFIEPGQTPEEVDGWFHLMHESGFSICRIRLFENYIHKPDGTWDYSLFDRAYNAAEKYGIRVWGNFFPATPFTDVGGFKFPRSQGHLDSIANYIQHVVTHFRKFAGCDGWVLINEPGSGSLPDGEFTRGQFDAWKNNHNVEVFDSLGYPVFTFDRERFLVDYNTWYLGWLKDQVYQYDPGSQVHVNNHAIFQNVAEYDFPAWRKVLTSLGGSAHASWHFGYFNRNRYDVAMSANCEIIRSGAGNLPWLMTEMQGGNNIYSGFHALCPTHEEITQWLWTVIASGGKGAIFWTFNPRASGFEAGEWGMVTFQNEPSDRLKAAATVAHTLEGKAVLFAQARPAESGIQILYTRESLWVEKKLQTGGDPYQGRDVGGVMKSALSYFEALGELGVQCNLKEIDEFDFSRNDYRGQVIILAHQVSLPARYWNDLENFVKKGGKLMVDGLTGYYDGQAHCIMMNQFPLQSLFGAEVSEIKLTGNLFHVNLKDPDIELPAHCWQGSLRLSTARPIGYDQGTVVACRNQYGAGEVVWIPSLVGLGGRIQDYGPLEAWLDQELKSVLESMPLRFATRQPGMLMKTLKSGNSYITMVINKNSEKMQVIMTNPGNLKPALLFADKGGRVEGNTLSISPEETIVLEWK